MGLILKFIYLSLHNSAVCSFPWLGISQVSNVNPIEEIFFLFSGKLECRQKLAGDCSQWSAPLSLRLSSGSYTNSNFSRLPFYFQPGGHKSARHYIDMQDLSFIKLSITLLHTERGRFFPQWDLPLVTLEPRLIIYIYNFLTYYHFLTISS